MRLLQKNTDGRRMKNSEAYFNDGAEESLSGAIWMDPAVLQGGSCR